jgi:acetyl-CoA C-acetyltransferase
MARTGLKETAIVGVGMSAFETRRVDKDYGELLQESAEEALADSGLEMRDIDAVVLSQSPDVLHGVGQPEQLAVAALAAQGKPVVRVHTGGATGGTAAQVGWWLAASGRYRSVLVIGAEKMGDAAGGAQEALNKIWEPAYESLLPLNTIVMTALHAVRHMKLYGTTERQFAIIASRLRNDGMRNKRAHLRRPVSWEQVLEGPLLSWPVWRDMSCPRSSGSCAVIITQRDVAESLSAPKAWIRSISSRTNTVFMGDKMGNAGLNDHGTLYDLQLAAREAYENAGITDARNQIDVAEPYAPFANIEPAILEAIQLAKPGKAAELAEMGEWDFDGPLPVCPSGGVVCTNPIAVTALVRFAEAALQVRRTAGDHQVDRARTAVATGVGGSFQFWVVGVLADQARSD